MGSIGRQLAVEELTAHRPAGPTAETPGTASSFIFGDETL